MYNICHTHLTKFSQFYSVWYHLRLVLLHLPYHYNTLSVARSTGARSHAKVTIWKYQKFSRFFLNLYICWSRVAWASFFYFSTAQHINLYYDINYVLGGCMARAGLHLSRPGFRGLVQGWEIWGCQFTLLNICKGWKV